MSDNDFIKMCRDVNPSSSLPSGTHDENLRKIKSTLNQKENNNTMKTRKIRKSALVAAVALLTLGTSALVFGADIVNYFRTINLSENVTFIPVQHEDLNFAIEDYELNIDEAIEFNESGYAIIDFGDYKVIVSDGSNSVIGAGISFTDPQEALDLFAADALLPTFLPEGFELERIAFFVQTMEELSQYDANFYMAYIFSNGYEHFSVQVRYVTPETAFELTVGPEATETKINGHNAVIEDGIVSIMINDVLYMFFGTGAVSTDDLVKMAYSLQ